MTNPLEKQTPFVKGNLTRLRLVFPCSPSQAWKLIVTSKGLASRFPTSVKGKIQLGKTIEFGWSTGSEKHRVTDVKRGESWQMDWWKTGRVRYSKRRQPNNIHSGSAIPEEGRRKTLAAAGGSGLGFLPRQPKVQIDDGRDLRSNNPSSRGRRGS
jgi:hypothetical protein